MRVHPSPTTRVLSDVCFPVSQPPLSGPDSPWLLFTLTCLLLKLPFLAQLFLLFCLRLLDPLPGSAPRAAGTQAWEEAYILLGLGHRKLMVSLFCLSIQEMGVVLPGSRKQEPGLGLGEGCP